MSGDLARVLAGLPWMPDRNRGRAAFGLPPDRQQAAQPPSQPPVWESLPPYQPPGSMANKYMPIAPPQQTMPPVTAQASPLPPTPMMAAAAPPNPGYIMPPQEQYGPQEPYGPQAPPMPRNELERDYYRQLAASPGGFDKGWLGRVFG